MKINKTLALALHRAMWTDMQTELGNNPTPNQRSEFKAAWILKYFPNENVVHNCFLCEYAFTGDSHSCCACPIRWPGGQCASPNFSYAKAPISDILALPEKGKWSTGLEAMAIYAAHDETVAVRTYYGYREELLSRASGLPGSVAIEDHVKAIQEKAVAEKAADVIDDFLYRCEKYPDTPINEQLKKRLCAIQEKAVDDYFAKMPLAKAMTTDIDDAFSQYAKEQKAPIFHALAGASGLSAGNESVKAHISAIRDMAKQNGRMERSTEIFKELAKASGLPEGKWCISDHIKAIQERAKEQMEPYVKSSTLLLDTLNKYKDCLSDESDLDRNRPVDDHIREIVKNSMEAGAAEERDRIQEKIYEVLLS